MTKQELYDNLVEENINLYNSNHSFWNYTNDPEQYKAWEKWMENRAEMQRLKNEILAECAAAAKAREAQKKESKTFVNAYGEATKRYITTATYERQQKRQATEIMRRMAG